MSLTWTKKIINNSWGLSDNMGAARREKGNTSLLNTCLCLLAEFRPAPGFCPCQTSRWYQRGGKKKNNKTNSSRAPYHSFPSSQLVSKQFADHQEQKLWLRGKFKKKTKREKVFSFTRWKYRKFIKERKWPKSTSSKTEVALLSLHSMLKWLSTMCLKRTAHLADSCGMLMEKLNSKC